jgi:hypothetical protein
MKRDDVRQGFGTLWESVAEGREGVLKVDLPKRHPGRSPVRQIPVA